MRPNTERGSFHRRGASTASWLLIAAGAVVLRTWLVSAQDLSAVGAAGHDDRLFVVLAEHLTRGDWLGSFNQFTLAKGPFYPLWIALVHWLGTPLLLAQHLLYSAACALFVYALRPLKLGGLTMMLLFLLLLFNPASYADVPMTRVVREGIYPALSLVVLSAALALALRPGAPGWRLIAWGSLLGIALGALWLTREEGIWILPALGFFLGVFVYRQWLEQAPRVRLLVPVMPLIIAACIVASVAAINFYHYGVFTIVDLKRPTFQAAYGALTRVVATDWRADVPVSHDVRHLLYRESPAFRELRPYLEGDVGSNWRTSSRDRSDIGGGWFIWALRGAVAWRGYYASAAKAEDFYGRLLAEIEAACDAGKLECTAPRASLMPPWREAYTMALGPALAEGLRYLISFDDLGAIPTPSTGTLAQRQLFNRITGESLSSGGQAQISDGRLRITGWALHITGSIQLVVGDRTGAPAAARIVFGPSPDVLKLARRSGQPTDNAHRARFELETACLDNCVLDILNGDGVRLARLSLPQPERLINEGGLYFVPDVYPAPEVALRLGLLQWITHAYQAAFTLLGPASLLFMLLACSAVRRHPGLAPGCMIVTGLGIAVASRLLVLALIDVTSFPAMHKLYLSAAYPLYIAAVVLMLVLAGSVLAETAARRRASRPEVTNHEA